MERTHHIHLFMPYVVSGDRKDSACQWADGDACLQLLRATQQCYDPSLGGTVAFSSSASRPTPQQWGGIPDSSTNSTAALQACINSAWATGTLCDLPGSTGTYNTTGLTLPTVVLNNWQLLGIEGEGSVHDMQSGKSGSVIHCTGSSDCIVGNLAVFSDAGYTFRDFSLIGPDSSSSGAISGHGFNINATAAAPRVGMSNISVLGFYGSGKYAVRLVGPENSNFTDVDTSDNNACAYLGGGFKRQHGSLTGPARALRAPMEFS